MTVSKGLTGGYLPMSITLTTDAVYNAFMRITASTRLLSTATRMQEILWAARRLMAS